MRHCPTRCFRKQQLWVASFIYVHETVLIRQSYEQVAETEEPGLLLLQWQHSLEFLR